MKEPLPNSWPELGRLIDQLLDTSVQQRDAVIASLSGGDAERRAELERLVEEIERDDGLLQRPVAERFAALLVDEQDQLPAQLAERYRITRELGRGGMATVYLAHDVRHDRKVALKVMHPELAAIVGVDRFLQEIKTTANLQHPHILPLFDSGSVGGRVFYVMPLVEGESLRDRLKREKQLPVDEALRLAREIADAMAHAHARDVIHRDIKPENILLQDGHALVADFGIARAAARSGGNRLTGTGMSLGTPEYMSPEQVTGARQLGPACDVYALGVVLYEMLAGEPPFTGPTAQAIIAKTMNELPVPVRARRSSVPPRVEAALSKSLAKIPADRFVSASQFAEALLGDDARTPHPSPGQPARLWRTAWLSWGLTAALAVVVGVQWMRSGAAQQRDARGPSQLTIALPHGVTPNWRYGVAVSPNGRIVAFVASNAEYRNQLYVKRVEEPNAIAIPGTVGAMHPTFAPDGQWVAFFQGNVLKKVSLLSGSVTALADSVREAGHAHWDEQGILFGRNDVGRATIGIERTSEAGANRVVLTRPDSAAGELSHYAPQSIPGTQALIYSVRGIDPKGSPFFRVMVLPNGGSARVLIEGASLARYMGDQRLVYQKGSDLYVARFDVSALQSTDAWRLVSGVVAASPAYVGATWAMSEDVLVYGTTTGPTSSFVWVDRNGRSQRLPTAERFYYSVKLSPNGERVAVLINDGQKQDVWTYDLTQDVFTRVSQDGQTYAHVWSPDGQQLLTLSAVPIDWNFYRLKLAGGEPQFVIRRKEFFFPAQWTKDGRRVVVMDRGDLAVLSMDDTTVTPLVSTAGGDLGGRLSPDERWLAYFSNVSGQHELYVTRFPQGGAGRRLTRTGARAAVWSHDGRELFYRSANGRQLLSIPITPGADFIAGPAQVLFEGDFFFTGGPGIVDYDVARDGKRFLMLQNAVVRSDLSIVINWDRVAGEARP